MLACSLSVHLRGAAQVEHSFSRETESNTNCPFSASTLCAPSSWGYAPRGEETCFRDLTWIKRRGASLNKSSHDLCSACLAKKRGGIHANDRSVFRGPGFCRRGSTDIPSGASTGCRDPRARHSSNRENFLHPTARLRLSQLYMALDLPKVAKKVAVALTSRSGNKLLGSFCPLGPRISVSFMGSWFDGLMVRSSLYY